MFSLYQAPLLCQALFQHQEHGWDEGRPAPQRGGEDHPRAADSLVHPSQDTHFRRCAALFNTPQKWMCSAVSNSLRPHGL